MISTLWWRVYWCKGLKEECRRRTGRLRDHGVEVLEEAVRYNHEDKEPLVGGETEEDGLQTDEDCILKYTELPHRVTRDAVAPIGRCEAWKHLRQ